MSDLPRVSFIVIIVVAGFCLLVVVFMAAGDRASEQPGGPRRFRSFSTSFAFGIISIVSAGLLSGMALDADRQSGLIPPTFRGARLTPDQGYGAAFVLLLIGLYAIFLSVRSTRRRQEDGARNT